MKSAKLSNFEIRTLAVGLFLITLQSFYFPVVGSGLTILGLMLLLIMSLWSLQIDKEVLALVGIFVFLLGISAAIKILSGIAEEDFVSLVATLFMVISIPFVHSLLRNKTEVAIAAMKYVILVHVGILFFQVGYWLLLQEYFDLLSIIIGVDSGSISKKGLEAFGMRVPRFSGLFNEPGTFSVVVMAMTIIYYILSKKVDYVLAAAVIASLASMSMFGIVLASTLCVVVVLTNNKYRLKIICLGLLFLILFASVGGIEAVVARFSVESEYGGVDFRAEMIRTFLDSPKNIILGMNLEEVPEFFVSNDAGLWFAFLVSYGLPGILLILTMMVFVAYKSRRWDVMFLVILLLMTKLKFTYPLFWVLYTLALVSQKKENDNKTR